MAQVAQEKLQPLVEREPADQAEAEALLHLAGFISKWDEREQRIAKLNRDNEALKRKMAYIEQRARDRMHGIIDVMWGEND